MNWYLIVKFLHILSVTLTIGGIFARQLVRGIVQRSDDVKDVASLTRASVRMDRALIIPSSNFMILLGVILALIQGWPILGFLQGAAQNWLLVSNVLLVIMVGLIPGMFIPHNKKVDALLQTALTEGRVTPELSMALNDSKNRAAHHLEEIIIIVVAALMVLKPF